MDIDIKGKRDVRYAASAASVTADADSSDTASADTAFFDNSTNDTSSADTAASEPPWKPLIDGLDFDEEIGQCRRERRR